MTCPYQKLTTQELDSDALDTPEPSSKKAKKPTPKGKGKAKQNEPDSDDLDGDEAFGRNATYQQSNIMKKAVAGSTVLKGIGHKMKCGECEKDFTVVSRSSAVRTESDDSDQIHKTTS